MRTPTTYLGWKVDFTAPAGEAAFAAPDSVSWQVFKNPVALAIGGICAVLLEFADPRIRSGVWDHSTFRIDPIGRARRTGIAAMVGVYGPQSAARRVIQGVTNMHARVRGMTPSGAAYAALDSDLLDWVGATAAYGFLVAYDTFVRTLSDEDKCRFFAESETVAGLYGARTVPRSLADFGQMTRARSGLFEAHPINTEFLAIMTSGRAAPGVPRGLQSAIVHAAVSILPGDIRDTLKLGGAYDLSASGRMAVSLMAKTAESVPDTSGPAAQASERLGLPRSFLWKNPADRQRHLDRLASRTEMQGASA